MRARKLDEGFVKLSTSERVEIARAQAFDLPNSVHEFKMPEIKGGISAKEMIEKMKGNE